MAQGDQQHRNPSAGAQDEYKQGPASIQGLQASELPGGGRGNVETDFGKETARRLPQDTGGVIGDEGGERGHADLDQADRQGGRKRN